MGVSSLSRVYLLTYIHLIWIHDNVIFFLIFISLIFKVLFAQQLFHKYRVKRQPQYLEEDKRITNELLNLWHQADPKYVANSNYLYSDPQWNDEWYLVRYLNNCF